MESKKNNAIIALLFVGVLMGALDISIVGPALPSIESSLQIGARYSGWIFSIYVLFNLIGISLFARLSDIYGRRNIYVWALAIFALGSLTVSLSHNFEFLLIGRAVQGFGASGIFPVATALVGDLFPVERRGRVLGLIGAVFGLAFMIGPFLAGALLHYFQWHVLFIINMPVSLILIYYSFKILPSETETNVSRIDWGGIITLGISLAAFTFGINNLNGMDWQTDITNVKVILPLSVAFVSAVMLLVIERRDKNPIIKFSFFRNRQIIIVGIIAVVTGIVQACFVFIPKFVVHNFSVDPSTASFMLTPFVVATAVGSPVFGRLIDQYGVKSIIFTGLVLLSAGFFMLSQTGNMLLLYYISGVFVGLGLSILSGSSLRYIMLNQTSAEDRAISQGMLTIFISIGQLTGSAVIGILLADSTESKAFIPVFAGLAALLLVMVFVSFGLDNARKIQRY